MAVHAPTNQAILVTGGTDFIGSHLVDALVPDNDLRILDTFAVGVPDRIPPATTVFEGAVRDDQSLGEAMGDLDLVYHEAAFVNVDRSIQDPRGSNSVDVRGDAGGS